MPYVIGAIGGGDSSSGFIDVDMLPPIADARPNTTYLRTTDLSLHYTKFEVTAPAVPTSWTETDITDAQIVDTFFGNTVVWHGVTAVNPAPPSSGNVNVWFNPGTNEFLEQQSGQGIFVVLAPENLFTLPTGNTIRWVGPLTRSGTIPVEPGTDRIDTERELREWLDANPTIQAEINANTTEWFIGYFGSGTALVRITAVVAGTPEQFNFNYELLGILALGPETNEFTGTTRTLAETARNTYASANADWLAFYNTNRNRFIELEFGTTRVFQARNAAMNGWDDITGFARGPAGPTGTFTGVTLSGDDLVFSQSSGTDISVDVSPLIDGLGNANSYFAGTTPTQNGVRFEYPGPGFTPLQPGDFIVFYIGLISPAAGSAAIRVGSFDYELYTRNVSTFGVDFLTEETYYMAVAQSTTAVQVIGPVTPGLNTAQVDARIAAWARAVNPSGTIPDARIPAAITRDTELQAAIANFLERADILALIATWARATSPTGMIPDGLIPADITRDSELAAAIADLLNQVQVDARIANALAAATTGNTENGITVQYIAATGKLNFVVENGVVSLIYDPATRIVELVLSDGSSLTIDLTSLAPLDSPAFTGTPTAPTAAAGTDTTQLATTAFVAAATRAAVLMAGDGVLTSADLSGSTLRLTISDGTVVTANLASLVAGVVHTLTANEGLEGNQTTGDVVVGIADGGVTFAKLASATVDTLLNDSALTGTPTAPTPPGGDSTTRLATTRFVENTLAGFITGVTAGSGLTGGGSSGDVTVGIAQGGVEYSHLSVQAILDLYASPDLTGTPTAPTAPANTNSTQIATTAFVEDATLGLPTESQVMHLIQNALRDAVTGNVETGMTVTYQTGGTLDFVLDADGVRNVLGLTQQEAIDLVTGISVSGQTMTVSFNGKADQTITLPAGGMGGMADGVLQSAALDATTGIATFTLTTGGTVTLDLSPLQGSTVSTDSTISGTGAAADPLSVGTYAGPAIATIAADFAARQFTFTHLSGLTSTLNFEDIETFHGVGGDTFTTDATFHFGDSAIVGSLLYIYIQDSGASFNPTTITTSNRFRTVPVLDATSGLIDSSALGTGGTTGQILTRTAAGQAWQDAVDAVIANPASAATEVLERVTIGASTYRIPDDVIDVTGVGLPVLTAENHRAIFIDHDTPRVWVGHREEVEGTPPSGNFVDYSNANFRGVFGLSAPPPPTPNAAGEFYYNFVLHSWQRASSFNGVLYWFQSSVSANLGGNARWLGEQPNDTEALDRIDFDSTHTYYYYNNSAAPGTIRQLDNSSYVPGTNTQVFYEAEPISTPAGVGTIAGVTAGEGLAGGGLAGVVSLGIDTTGATSGQVISFDGTGVAWADQTGMGGGLGSVSVEAPLTGDGTSGDPLGLDFTLAPVQTTLTATDLVAYWDTSASGVRQVTLGGFVAEIANQQSITTANGMMMVAPGGIEESHLDASNSPATGQVLSFTGGTNDFEWVDNAGSGATTFLGLTDTPAAYGTAGQLAAINSAGDALEFIDAPSGGGTGDITAVNTAAGSGLAGGVTSGAANLSVDIAGTTELAALNRLDSVLLHDASANALRRVELVSISDYLSDGTTIQHSISSGSLFVPFNGITTSRIADEAVTEPKLDVGNTPAANQVLSWDGSALQWVNQTGGGTGGGTGRYYAIPEANVGGTVDAITLTTGDSITLQHGDEFFFYHHGPKHWRRYDCCRRCHGAQRHKEQRYRWHNGLGSR